MNKEYKTPNGKKIEFFTKGFGIRVRFEGGGELPVILSGSYTTYQAAYTAVEMYLDGMAKKVKYKPELNKEDYARDDKRESIFDESEQNSTAKQPRKKVANAN